MPELSSHMLVIAWCLGGAVVLSLAVLGWLNISRAEYAKRWRREMSNEPFPHMHIVDGVVITHSHAGGEKEHMHKEITVSIEHYAALARRAQNAPATD